MTARSASRQLTGFLIFVIAAKHGTLVENGRRNSDMDGGMNRAIAEELKRIEREERLRILYACEAGSRAWGFPSKDSDYDVRFVYVRPPEWYLSIFERRDVVERKISDELDMNGWDLRKALNLFRKSNPPLLEWLQSPIRYLEAFTVAEQIRRLSPLTFAPRSCMYHYLHMAERNYREFLQGEQVRTKKYFYVLRPILACMWIEDRSEMPPMDFDVLVRELVPARSELHMAIEQLLERKRTGDSFDMEPRLEAVNRFLEEKMAYIRSAANSLPSAPEGQDERLDQLFRDALREVWESRG